jgi:hypothetical protein
LAIAARRAGILSDAARRARFPTKGLTKVLDTMRSSSNRRRRGERKRRQKHDTYFTHRDFGPADKATNQKNEDDIHATHVKRESKFPTEHPNGGNANRGRFVPFGQNAEARGPNNAYAKETTNATFQRNISDMGAKSSQMGIHFRTTSFLAC